MLILSWNCGNGIVHKMDEIRLMLEKHNPSVFFISEAELTTEQENLIALKHYKLEISDSIKLGKSRLVAYHKHNDMHRMSQLEGNCENIIVLENRTTRIIGLYRGFKNYRQPGFDALGYLFDLLEEASKTTKDLTIIGDFNIDPMRDQLTPQGRKLESLQINNVLYQLVNFTTRSRVVQRITGTSLEESMIDLVLTNKHENKKTFSETTTSDHKLIGLRLRDVKTKAETKKTVIRDWTQLSPRNVARLASGAQDPTSFNELTNTFNYLLNKLAPLRVIRTRLPENIVNPKVEKIKKKRDRLYRQYKISLDDHYLHKVKAENRKLKKMITSETHRVFQKKAQGINCKSFWQTVNQLQGKIKNEETYLTINGVNINDDQTKADTFADYFEEKILKLTSGMSPIEEREKKQVRPAPFTNAELADSLCFFKTKMSSGPDEIPMRLVKFYAQKRPVVILDIFNEILSSGFPDQWRLARVTPVPKKGDLKLVSSYRPVSNLPSLSKLFERCILHRLMRLPNYNEMLGAHQHGFRPGHSTTSCLLQLKDTICEKLDDRENVLAYSLDLSAAFDMLRPDTFVRLLNNKIPDDLLCILDEFLTDRKFYVEINGKASQQKSIDRGCPQGSVLGPVLFNLYTGTIKDKLPLDVHLTSYADDSYVIINDKDQEELIKRTETCLQKHVESFEEIGMKVNEGKTEIMLFGRENPKVLINVKGEPVESKDQIKALGIIIDKGLSWRPHISLLKKRVMKVVGGVRMVRNKLTESQTTTVVTAQIFSILYYACCVWLTPTLNKKLLGSIESLHYRALRLIIRDFRNKVSRDDVTKRTKRLPPDKWAKFALSSLFLNMYGSGGPLSSLERISRNTYQKRRKPGFMFSYDSSRTKLGKQMTKNWLGSAINDLPHPWVDKNLTKNSVRVFLKKAYYCDER